MEAERVSLSLDLRLLLRGLGNKESIASSRRNRHWLDACWVSQEGGDRADHNEVGASRCWHKVKYHGSTDVLSELSSFWVGRAFGLES